MKEVYVEVFLQKSIAPSWNLKATKKFTPSKPFQKVMPPPSPLGGPSMQFDFFCSSHLCPSPIILFSIRSPRWQCNVLPFSWPSIIVERIDTKKWFEEFEKILSFIHQLIHFSMPFLLNIKCLLAFWFWFLHLFLPM